MNKLIFTTLTILLTSISAFSQNKYKVINNAIKQKQIEYKNGMLVFKSKNVFRMTYDFLNNYEEQWTKDNNNKLKDINEYEPFLSNFEKNFIGFISLRKKLDIIEDSIWSKKGEIKGKDLAFDNGMDDDELNTILNANNTMKIGSFIYYIPRQHIIIRIPDFKNDLLLYKQFMKDNNLGKNEKFGIRYYNLNKENSPLARQANSVDCDLDCEITINKTQLGCNEFNFVFQKVEGDDCKLLTEKEYTWKVTDDNGNVIHTINGMTFDYNFPESEIDRIYNVDLIVTYTYVQNGITKTCYLEDDMSVPIPGMKLDFEITVPDPCTPKKIKITDISILSSAFTGATKSYIWNIYNNSSLSPIESSTNPNPIFSLISFPNGEYFIELFLTLTIDGVTCQRKIKKQFTLTDECKPDIKVTYLGCPKDLSNGNGKVKFFIQNNSIGGVCPTYKFYINNILQNGLNIIPNQTSPPIQIPYTPTNNNYTFKIEMYNQNGTLCNSLTKNITVTPCNFDFNVIDCNNGQATINHNGNNPTWIFSPDNIIQEKGFCNSNSSKIKIEYSDNGTFQITGKQELPNGCVCIINKAITLNRTLCCYRNVSMKKFETFTHQGKSYKVKIKLCERNGILSHYIKAKTKVKGSKPIQQTLACFEGKWFSKNSSCCNCADEHTISQSDGGLYQPSSGKKDKHVLDFGMGNKIRVRENSVTSTHRVKVNNSHTTPWTFNLSIGNNLSDTNLTDWNGWVPWEEQFPCGDSN